MGRIPIFPRARRIAPPLSEGNLMSQAYLDLSRAPPLPRGLRQAAARRPGRAALRTLVAGSIMMTLLAAGIVLRLVACLPGAAHLFD